MKKFKFLPSVLMLVLCVAVLAVGIYAVQPTQNTIEGSITINAVNSPVKLELFIDKAEGEPLHTYPEVRGGEQIKLDELLGEENLLNFDLSKANNLEEVPPRKIIIRVTNLSTDKMLGAYYLNKEISQTTLISTTDTVYDNTNKSLAIANVTLPSYTILNANNQEETESTASQDLTIEFNMATWEQGTAGFTYYLYIEEFARYTEDGLERIETYYEETTASDIITPELAITEQEALSALTEIDEQEEEQQSIFASTTLTADDFQGQACGPDRPNIVIPEGVEVIGAETFIGCSYIETILIPSSISSLGMYAFNECTSLTNISFPNNLTRIDLGAFAGCIGLKEVILPNSLTYLQGEVFCGCTGLETVVLPASIQTLQYDLFSGCESLTSITLPDSVISIGDSAFSGCESLESINIPERVTTIGYGAFANCTNVTEIYFNATKLNEYENEGDSDTFYDIGSSNDGVNVYIGKNVTKIPDYFLYTTDEVTSSIKSVIFEEGSVCESIGTWAFRGCIGLESINMPASVTSIGTSAFRSCTSVTSITIPENLTYLGSYAFYDCTGVTEIYYNAINLNGYEGEEDNHVFYNVGADTEGVTAYIGANVEKLPKYCFCPEIGDCWMHLKTVVFEENSICDNIGNDAFNGCTSLESITIPDGVTSIGDGAFTSCESLTSITIPDSVTSIGNSAFNNCTSLSSITIPDGVTSIGDGAFSDLPETAYTTLNGIKYIKSKTNNYFAAVGYTEQIPANAEIHNLCKIIVGRAFYGCTSLKSITIPDSVTSIGDSAFYGCTSLTSITIPDSVTSIGNFAFSRCTSLASITIPDSVTSIGVSTFYVCSSLKTIVVEAHERATGTTSYTTILPTIEGYTWYVYEEDSETGAQVTTNYIQYGNIKLTYKAVADTE